MLKLCISTEQTLLLDPKLSVRKALKMFCLKISELWCISLTSFCCFLGIYCCVSVHVVCRSAYVLCPYNAKQRDFVHFCSIRLRISLFWMFIPQAVLFEWMSLSAGGIPVNVNAKAEQLYVPRVAREMQLNTTTALFRI